MLITLYCKSYAYLTIANFKNIKKAVIIPVYKDIDKLDWINIIPKEFKIIIYEKKDEIKKETSISPNHYLIPALGEGCFVNFYHIVKSYNNLEDILHFTKTHWIPDFATKDIFLQDLKKDVLYSQHITYHRSFIYCFEDIRKFGHKEGIISLLKDNNKWKDGLNIISYTAIASGCLECKSNKECYKCSEFGIDSPDFKNIIFKFSYLNADSACMKKMKQLFKNFNPKTKLINVYADNSYSIKKELILYHDISVYKKLLDELKRNQLGSSNACHDEIITFVDLFWKETLKNYKNI